MFPGGKAEEALLRIIEGRDQLLISKSIIKETVGVLSRKFSRDQEELARVAVYMAEIGELVTPRQQIKLLKDEPDNRILECAVEGGATTVVTGDRELLELREFSGIHIITLKEYLEFK